MKKLVGFGDFLLRLNPPGYLRFLQADRFEINYTGAEANVCVSLARMGVETEFVTRLPENEIAQAGVAELRKFGVGTRHIVFGGERMGVFYLEKGASQRPSRIIYDRKYTSIATCACEDFDWDAIFGDASHFHITGITPALSETIAPVCVEVCRKAREKGVTVSCDLNYRAALWSPEEARACLVQMLRYVDILIVNEEHAAQVLGIRARNANTEAEACEDVARQLCDVFGMKAVALTLRSGSGATENTCSGMLYIGGKAYFSREYTIHLVDRIGGGDALTAGLLYGLMNDYAPQEAIDFAAAAGCLKQTIEMDFNLSTVEEVRHLMEVGSSGRVRR